MMGTLATWGWGAVPELGDNISAKAVIWSHRHTEAASLEVTRLQPESVQAPRPVSQATQRTEAGLCPGLYLYSYERKEKTWTF